MRHLTRSAKGRTFVFAGRRSTFKGLAGFAGKTKLTKIDEKSLRCSFAHEPHEKNVFFHSWTRLSIDSGCLGALPDAPRRSFWPRRTALQTLRVLPEHARDAPRRSKDTPGTLLGATGRAQRVPGSILRRFWEPWSLSRDRC